MENKNLEIGDVVVLNYAKLMKHVEVEPQMVVKKIDGDFITCDFFNKTSYIFQNETFHKQQLTLVKQIENR